MSRTYLEGKTKVNDKNDCQTVSFSIHQVIEKPHRTPPAQTADTQR